MISESGRYRIQSVAEMTGVSSATLRAWERRYGIPSPQRTASAYRLYTDRDVELIKGLRELCDRGIAPAQAAQMVKVTDRSHVEAVQLESDAAELGAQKILAGIEQFDPDMVEAAVRHASLLGSGMTLFERVFAPVMAEVGNRWRAGSMNIAQEHLATQVITATTLDLIRLLRPSSPSRTALLACVAGEAHALPVLAVALAMAEWNIRTVVLGADTPPEAIRCAVAEVRPDLVGLSSTTAMRAEDAGPLLRAYAEACGRTPWIVGGRGTTDLHGLIEACGATVAPSDRIRLHRTLDRLTTDRLGDR